MSDVKRKQQTFNEYIVASELLLRENPGLRRGQAYMNTLHEFDPELCRRVTALVDGDDWVNPYHVDDRLDDFLVFVSNVWKST